MSVYAHYQNLVPQTSAHRARFAQFCQTGFPSKALEAWHYTDFSNLADLTLPAAALVIAPQDTCVTGINLALDTPPAPEAFNSLFALDDFNAALAQTGSVLTLAGSDAIPVVLTHGCLSGQVHVRHQIQVAAGAKRVLAILEPAGEQASLLTAVLALNLAEGSQLTIIRVQSTDTNAIRALHVGATLADHAQLHVVNLDFGGKKIRNEWHVTLAGPNSHYAFSGLTAAHGKQQVDTHLQTRHQSPDATSKIVMRMIAADKAKAVFTGKVLVGIGADKTNSDTQVGSLLMNDSAEIDAKPELEIYADDVKCAHGATFGQLNADALFYLRARGLSVDEAKTALTMAFAEEILNVANLPALHQWASDKLRALLTAAPTS